MWIYKDGQQIGFVHSDICGPFDASMRGFSYFVTFIDDSSDMIFLDTLKVRSDIIDALENFIELVSSQKNDKIQIMRTDNA